jgi:uncharacterized protein Yka (UPF0111/DUF47 family)
VLFTAELAMHSERVSRHINGTEQTLVELRQSFRSMIENYQQQMERFRDEVDRFEQQFAFASKSSRYAD